MASDALTGAVGLGVMMNVEVLREPPDVASAYCRRLEEAGVDSVWIGEHVAVADRTASRFPGASPTMSQSVDTDRPDPLLMLTWLAARSSTLLLGSAVALAPLHHPVTLAKRAATLDVLSGGRLRLGLGVGWQIEEYDALGVPFVERGARLRECAEAMRCLWSGGPATFRGHHFAFEDIYSAPRPTTGRVPIVFGGHSRAAIERTGALGDGWFPFSVGVDVFRDGVTRIRELAAGRQVEFTAWPGGGVDGRLLDAVEAAAFVAAGADRIVVRPRWGGQDPVGEVAHQLEAVSVQVRQL